VIESDEFYAHCDRLGILVWQEFAQSSSGLESIPSDDPDFVATLAADAREIVPRRAHHPSLAIWCGGNELDADDSHPAIAVLRAAADRAWLPTSPLGDKDVHGPWEHQGLRAHNKHFDTRTSRLHSEFGVEGMTNSLDGLIAAEHQWPADRSNPVYQHLGAWWNNAPLVQECFGGRIEDTETMRRASQWLQYEGLRYAVEATRRRGAGTIPWQFNESFPNAWCTCAVDWHGDPKPAYHGVARAYRGAPTALFATNAWGGLEEARAIVSAPARFVDLDGRVVAEGQGEITAPLDVFAHDVFLLDLDSNRYVMTRTEHLAPLLDLPRTTLVLDGSTLRNTGAVAAVGVVTDGDVLDLLPGEAREIEGARAEGWNAAL
jgi:beta-mannosidase